MAGGIVWAGAGLGAAACWVLVTSSSTAGAEAGWTAPALGALGGLIFGLRSRMFSRAQHVGTMLAVVAIVLVAVAVRAPTWLGLPDPRGPALTVIILALIGLLGVASGLGSLREVPGARLQRALERLELVELSGSARRVDRWLRAARPQPC